MTSLDFLYISLGVGFLILVGFVSYMAYEGAKTLKSLRETIDHVDNIVVGIEDFTMDLSYLKDRVKVGSLSFFNNVLKSIFGGRSTRGGEY